MKVEQYTTHKEQQPESGATSRSKEGLGIVEKYSTIIYEAPLPHPDHIHKAVKEACQATWNAAMESAAKTVERCGMTYASGDSSVLAEDAVGAIAAAVRMGKMPNS